VILPNGEEPGTVIIDSRNKRLYFIINTNEVFVYPISVGREGFDWSGTEQVSRIQYWPDWTPPKEMLRRRPDLPVFMAGGLKNPLGAVAIYLGDTLYRIHGTNDPASIGRAESSGCIRMMNEHALHLASIVGIGTTVKVFK
jgi:lipoprotein-anchoring transpeptidase ErfK/SrfK